MDPLHSTVTLPAEPEVEAIPSRIVKDDLQLLGKKSEDFDFKNPQMDPIELSKLLVREMVDQKGLGISAIQLGIPLRVFAIQARPQNVVLFNPIIVHSSTETATEPEGCLSFPYLIVKVKRPFEVRCRFRMPNEQVRTEKWGGLTARVVQHEMDHLDGVLFFNKAGRFHRDQAFRKRDQYLRVLETYKR